MVGGLDIGAYDEITLKNEVNLKYENNEQIISKEEAIKIATEKDIENYEKGTINFETGENGPERYVYYVDCTTGEIIGGARWSGEKRPIERLLQDPYNLVEK